MMSSSVLAEGGANFRAGKYAYNDFSCAFFAHSHPLASPALSHDSFQPGTVRIRRFQAAAHTMS